MKKLPIGTKKLTITIDEATYKMLESIAKGRYKETTEELAADLLEWATTSLAGTILYKFINEEEKDN